MKEKLKRLLERRAHGRNLLTFEFGPLPLKNVNHIHVTYVLGEIVLIQHFLAAQATQLTACLLLHLLNLWLSMKDKAEASELSTDKLAVWVYHGFELFLFAVGCTANWRFMLSHAIFSYIVPFFFYGVQKVLWHITVYRRNAPNWLCECTLAVCMGITFLPFGFLFALVMIYPIVIWWFDILLLILYLVMAMPLMATFEEEEGNLFEFAFGLRC